MPEKKVLHNIINGEIQQSADGAMMDIINPATGEAYASAPNSSAADVGQAFQAAGAAFAKWLVDAERAAARAAQAGRSRP